MKNIIALVGFFCVFGSTVFSGDISPVRIPPSFDVPKSQNKRAVFVDMKTADYRITYYVKNKEASAASILHFFMPESGLPIIDLVTEPNSVYLNGVVVETKEIDLPNGGKVRVLDREVLRGPHQVLIQHKIRHGITFNRRGVKQAFFMSDLDDRSFLEQYLPTSWEYDQYAMKLKVEVKDGRTKQKVFTNGRILRQTNTEWEIEFPEYFNSSSPYFHITAASAMMDEEFEYYSSNGRIIPIQIYKKRSEVKVDLRKFKKKTIDILDNLENDFGPFPHQKVVIYGMNMPGGMEFSGAIFTGSGALSHELFHSYFARGVLPDSGNSGWMDEAFARWRDHQFRGVNELTHLKANLANRGEYVRATTRLAYKEGANFLGYLSYLFETQQNPNSLKDFLREFLTLRMHQTVNSEILLQDLERYFQQSLHPLFRDYVYGGVEKGQELPESSDDLEDWSESIMHLKLNRKLLESYL